MVAGADRSRILLPGAAHGNRRCSLTTDLSQPGPSAGERAISLHPEPGRPDAGAADAGSFRRLSLQRSQDDRRGTLSHHGRRQRADAGDHYGNAPAVSGRLSADESCDLVRNSHSAVPTTGTSVTNKKVSV